MNDEAEGHEWRRLDWDTAEEHPGVAGGFTLVVEGVSPVPMIVELRPGPIPIVPVDYWWIEVRGRPEEPHIEVETPWSLQEDTKELPHGKKGYVLAGATKRAYFPPMESGGEAATQPGL